MSGDERPGPHGLRLIEGGAPDAGVHRAKPHLRRPLSLSSRPMGGIAEEMSGPVREAERRIGLLLTGQYGPLRDLQREELLAASEAAELLASVLDLVGVLEREDAGSQKPGEVFDLRFVIWDSVEEVMRRARQKRVSIDLSLPSTAVATACSRAAVRSVLRFALRAQLHAARQGGRIHLSGDVEGPVVSLRIERLDPAGRFAVGTARPAALALARALLEKQGGALQVRSEGKEWKALLPSGERGERLHPPNG